MLLYKRRLAFCVLAVAASCGDNQHPSSPDAQPPPPDGGAPACSLDLAAGSLAGGAWDPRFTVAGFTGPDGHAPTVYDFARDVDGSILAVGEFSYVGSDRVAPLMRWKNGAWQPARTTWELQPPGGGFSAVAVAPDGTLALATYDDFGERSGEIWLDDGTGLRVIGAFDGLIRRLAWYDGKLWAAGWDQIHSGKTELQGLAVWDGAAWAAPPGGSPTGFVYDLVPDGTELLVGGYFDHIGGIAANSVAAYDGTTWRAMSFAEPVGIYALARGADNALYAGGTIGNVVEGAGGLMRWTGTEWTLAAGGIGNRMLPGVVTGLANHDGSLYVGGCFRTAGGPDGSADAVTTPNVARYDGTWHALNDDSLVLAPWYEEKLCGDEDVNSVWDVSSQRVFSTGDRVLLAGSAPGVSGVLSQGLISYDGTAWHPEGGAGGLGIGGSLDKVAVSPTSCEAWGLGRVTHAGGAATRAHLLHFTGTGWSAIDDTLPVDAYCPAFAISPSGDPVVTCMIFLDSGASVSRVYHVSGNQLAQVGGDLPLIQTLAYGPDGTLWVAGGDSTGFVGRLDGETLTMVEQGFDAPVGQIDPVAATDVIVAGSFTKVGTLDASRIARWNGTTWAALGAGLPASVSALAHDATTVYVSTYDEGAGQYLLGAFDGTTWKDLATPAAGLTPQGAFNFNAIKPIDGGILAVGTAFLDDNSGQGALLYQNGRFTGLGGGGVHAVSLSGLAVSHDSIWVGGAIAEAGTSATATPSVGIAHYMLAP